MNIIACGRSMTLILLAVGHLAVAQSTLLVPSVYPSIREAIEAASDGDTVLVAPGTYTGIYNRSLSFGGKDIVVMSESGPDQTILDCEGFRCFTFTNNEPVTATLQGLTIINCDVSSDGGGIKIEDASCTINQCYFENNEARVGGAIYIRSDGFAIVENCTFINNRSTNGFGGAISNSGYLDLSESYFEGNRASIGGGGCSSNIGIIQGCTFENNYSSDYGGGLWVSSGTFVQNCVFFDNICDGQGGGAWGKGIFENCEFQENIALGGGGIHLDSNSEARQCEFVANMANYGGGCYLDDESNLSDSTFIENYSSIHGGGIYYRANGSAISRTKLLRNYSDEGGGIFIAGEGNIVNCELVGNIAENAAAIGASRSSSIINTLIVSNIAEGVGGIWAVYSTSVTNCVLIGNHSSKGTRGALFSPQSGSALVENSIFWGNTAQGETGENAAFGASSNFWPEIHYSCVEGWTGSLGGTGNFGDDPLFVNPLGMDLLLGTDDDDYRLLLGSPCIDAGNSQSVPLDVADMDADGDTEERHPLDFQLQPRFMDDPNIADTGLSDPPLYPEVVDIGIHEGGVPGFLAESTSFSIHEGEIVTISIVLNEEPEGTVQASVSVVGEDASVEILSGESLTFTPDNYAEPHEVEFLAIEDENFASEVAHVSVLSEEYPGVILSVETIDNDVTPSTIFVDRNAPGSNTGGSWHDALTELSDALELAHDNPVVDTICIAQGTWIPDTFNDGRQATFSLRGNLTLIGGFAGNAGIVPGLRNPSVYITRLSGDINGDDQPDGTGMDENVYHVVSAHDIVGTVTLDGVTVSGGNADDVIETDASGGGIVCVQSSLTLQQCTIEGNRSTDYGGGILALAESYEVVALSCIDCRFLGNEACRGGAVSVGNRDRARINVELSGCTFSDNQASPSDITSGGGGIYLSVRNSCQIEDCVFTGNAASGDDTRGGAVWIDYILAAEILRCQFSENLVIGTEAVGGALALEDSLSLADEPAIQIGECSFDRNGVDGTDGRGSAIWNEDILIAVSDCKFTNNYVRNDADYTLFSVEPTTLERCIFTNNLGGYVNVYLGGTPMTIRNCLIAFNGGGGLFSQGTHDIINSTIYGNSGRGIVAYSSSRCYIYNSIVYDNAPSGSTPYFHNQLTRSITMYGSPQFHLYHSCIHDLRTDSLGYFITNCFGMYPEFVDLLGMDGFPETGDEDLHLAEGSPCINRGDYTSDIEIGELDVEGGVRLQHCVVDIGAYESGYWVDCNSNGIPDGCDIADGTSPDVDGDMIPDECGTDCNANGISDFFDVGFGTSIDCNENQYPDECDISEGGSFDCNTNGIPDECEIDCNTNGVPDDCDIRDGTSLDSDGNGIPDDCQDWWFVDANAPTGGDGASWQTAFRYLQDALAIASSGDRIWVADGVYHPDESEYGNVQPGNRRNTFAVSDEMYLVGGFPGIDDPDIMSLEGRNLTEDISILSGDLEEDDGEGFTNILDNCFNVIRVEKTGDGTLIDGFTITGGNGDDTESDDITLRFGSGCCIVEASPTISNCIFSSNTVSHYGAGIMAYINSHPLITNCVFEGNRAYSGAGVGTRDSSSPTISHCLFYDNHATVSGGAMYTRDNGDPYICNCTIANNTAERDGGAIYNTNNSIVTMANCIVWGNTAPSDPAILNNNDATISVMYSDIQDGWPGTNINVDPLFVAPSAYDYRLSGGSPCIDAGDNEMLPEGLDWDVDGRPRRSDDPDTTDTGNGIAPIVDMGAYEFQPDCNDNGIGDNQDIADGSSLDCNTNGIPDECESDCNMNSIPDDCDIRDGTSQDADSNGIPDECQDTWFVDAEAPTGGDGLSWQTAFRYLQDAMAVAGVGDRVLVADGVYFPDESEYGNAVSGDRRSTFSVLDQMALVGGFPGIDDPGILDPEDRNLAVNASILSGDLEENDGEDFTNVEDNSYNLIRAEYVGSSTLIDGFTIIQGHGNDPDTADVTRKHGAGCLLWEASPTISNCIFHSHLVTHYGAGIMMFSHSYPLIKNCVFQDNRAYAGPGIGTRNLSSPVIFNCLLYNNHATSSGGALFNREDGNPLICNCTIVDNTAENAGGAIYNYDCDPIMMNCIVWGNTAPNNPAIKNNNATISVSYSDIQGDWSGTNINVDPLFVAAEAYDYRLSSGSPCIDAGDNEILPEGLDWDMDGQPRQMDDPDATDAGNGTAPIVDMGAYEYQPGNMPDGDCDHDDDVDLMDFAQFQICFGSTDPSCLEVFDFDVDGIIALPDFSQLEQLLSGP